MHKRRFSLAGLLALSLFAGMSTFAQTGQATLTGTISDPSGAVMANATITAKHLSTGTILSAASSSTGNYTISNMPIGDYEISVEQPGFKRYLREGITLISQQVLRMDVALEVGATGESITVTAEASLMKTDSGQVVHNVTMREIQTLPLIPVTDRFRDPFAVAQLLPGVRYVTQSTMLVNGLPQGSVQFRIEGQVMGNARQGFQAITGQVQPSVDAIEQVAVQTSNFSAEFGSVAGALFSVTMRSGTNQYHGSASDYAANEVLNSFDPAVHLRDKVRRHDWSVTFGGPIKIPKIFDGKNKTFFFGTYERYNQRLTTVANANSPTVPIQAYRDGDFSRLLDLSGNRNLTIGTGTAARDYKDPLGGTILAGTVFDPRTTRQVACNTALSQDCGANGALLDYRLPFPGNRVPTTLFDPVPLAIQTKYIPLPAGPRAANNEVINNFQVPVQSQRLSIIPSLKVDHNLNSTTRINGYWQLTRSTAPVQAIGGAEGFPDPITANRGTYQTSNSLRFNYEQSLRPTLQFHLGLAYSLFDWMDRTIVTDYNPLTDIGWRGATMIRNFPRFAANTQTTAGGVGVGGMNAMGPSPQGSSPERRPAVNTTLTWTKGNHTVKFGAEWRMDILPTGTFTNTAGTFGALGNGITWQPSLQGVTLSGAANVGFPYAEFLMGSVRGFTLSVPINYRTSKHQWGTYLQDSWRVNRKLTVGYGLRWDYGTYTREDYGRNGALSLLEPNPSASGRPGAIIYEATCKCTFAKNYPFGIGPRTDFAYTMNEKTVFRGGFGVAYGSTDTFGGTAQNSATTANLVNGQDAFKMRDGVPSNISPQWPFYDPALGHAVGTVQATVPTLLDPNAGRPSRTYQWNLSLQREITRNLVIEASYVGNRGIWQSASTLVSHNAVSPELLASYGFTVGDLNDATLLNKTLANLTTAEASTLRARGVFRPYSNFPTNQTLFQSLRPFPQYNGAINSSSAPLGKSWYDALQITANKRYSSGLQFNINYTYAKNLQSRGVSDVFNRGFGNKDVDANNLPWQIRIAVDYQLPKPSPDIPVLGNRVLANAIGGWGVALSLRYQPGFYLGRPASGATNGINRWLQRGPGGAQLKRNPDGSHMSPWAINWTDYDGKVHPEPLDVNCHCYDPEKTIVFNPQAWEAVPDGVWASDQQQLPFFRGPRQPQENANLSRNFKFGKDGKFGLQIRVEMQNVLNRKILPIAPSIAGLNFNTAPTPTSDGRFTSGFGTFGNLRSAGIFGPQRSGIFVGRFTF
jgi:hypothetical protein